MKNIFKKLFVLILVCITVIPLLFACGDNSPEPQSSSQASSSVTDEGSKDRVDSFNSLSESEKAFYIFNTEVNEDIFKTDLTFTLSTSIAGREVEAEASGYAITALKDGALSEYQELRMSTTMAGSAFVQKQVSGYIDGRYFQKISVDGVTKSADYSEMSLDDYLTEKKESSVSTDSIALTEKNCKLATFKKGKTGNYIATFTNISDGGLEPFRKMIAGSFQPLASGELKDVTLVLTVTPDFVPVSMSIDFEFEGENPPLLSLSAAYTFDDGLEIPEIDWSEYSEKVTPDNFDTLSEAEQAFYLLRTDVEDSNFLTIDSTMSYSMYLDNRQLTLNITQKSMLSVKSSNYEEYTVSTIESKYMGQKESSVIIQGYIDGNFFIHITQNGYVSSAEAIPMTVSEYLAKKQEAAAGTPEYFGITEENCDRATCVKGENNYTAEFSLTGGAPIEYFHSLAVNYLSILKSYTLRGVTLTITANDQLLPTKVTARCYYGSGALSPIFVVKTAYTYGVAEIPEMDWSIFKFSNSTQNPPSAEL